MVERTTLLVCRRHSILCTVRRVGYLDIVTIGISNVTLEHEPVRAGGAEFFGFMSFLYRLEF